MSEMTLSERRIKVLEMERQVRAMAEREAQDYIQRVINRVTQVLVDNARQKGSKG